MKLEAFLRENTRGNPETLRTYLKEIARFQGWLGARSLSIEAAHEYADWLAKKYSVNSLIPKVTAVNAFLAWKGATYRLKRPQKQIAPNPRLVSDEEYRAILGRIEDPAERLIVRLLHDSLLRPSDLVTLRVPDLADEDGILIIRKETKKAKIVSESILSAETAEELRAHLASGRTDYLFQTKPGKPRHRTWPNGVLKKHGAEGISPRTFRRTGATLWGEDLKSLMAQGSWNDLKTILLHYRRNLRERHVKAFEEAIGKAKDRLEEESGSGPMFR